MPFDSNGVFSRVMNWTSDQQNGIAIECGRHDAEDDNFAQGFNDCFCRDGRAAATGDFNLGNYKLKNVAEGTATTDAVNKGQLDTGLSAKQATITGAASSITSSNLTASKAVVSNASGKIEAATATAAEVNFLSGVTSAIQTQLNGKIEATINKSAKGYCKFSNGLIVQWGTISTGNGSGTETFPTAFSNTNYSIIIKYEHNGSISSSYGHENAYKLSASQFKWFRERDVRLCWIAVGY